MGSPAKGNQDWRTPPSILEAIDRSWPGFVDAFPPGGTCLRWALACNEEDPKTRAAAFKRVSRECYREPCSSRCGWAPPIVDAPSFRQGPWCAAAQAWRAHARDVFHEPGVLTLQPNSGTPSFAVALRASSYAIAFGRIAFVDPDGAGRSNPPAYPVWLLATRRPSVPWTGPGDVFEVVPSLRPVGGGS